MSRTEKIASALSAIHERLEHVEDQSESIRATLDQLVKICIETQELASKNRSRIIDEADRLGTKAHKHERQILEANARIGKLERHERERANGANTPRD